MPEEKSSILDVAHVSSRNGTSYRVTLPKSVVNLIDLTPDDPVVVFYLKNGKLVLDKLKGK